MLCKALKRAEQGELPHEDAKTLIGLANQIQANLAVEVKVATMKMRLGGKADDFGSLDVTE